MAQFLETLERIQMEQSDLKSLFTPGNKDGVPVRRPSARQSVEYKRKLLAATKIVSEVYSGARPIWQLQEVMTTSDFPILFGDILDRSVLAAYQEWPIKWEGIAKRVLLRDFRDAKIFPPVWGADGPLDIVEQASPYPDVPVHEQDPILWSLDKYGRKIPISWETMINDDLDQFKDFPERLGRAARRTEDWNVVNLYAGTTGPKSTMYASGYKNIINQANGAATNNPPLTIDGLQDAYLVLNSMVDENGFPILREAVTLVVPPALEVTANNILNATQIWVDTVRGGGVPDNGSGGGHQTLNAKNWMTSQLNVVVNPYLPMVSTSSNANTSWYLFASPTFSREAIRIGFLLGHETPEIWMKSPNATRVGGGAVDAMEGDFDTDSIQYRIRHVLATAKIDPKGTVASNGTGS